MVLAPPSLKRAFRNANSLGTASDENTLAIKFVWNGDAFLGGSHGH
jgi:hypothetical protein